MRHVHVLGELRLLLGLPLLLREDAIPRQLEHLLRRLEKEPAHAAADAAAGSATDSAADDRADAHRDGRQRD